MRRLAFLVLVVAGCSKGATGNETPRSGPAPTPTEVAPAATPPPAPAPPVTPPTHIELTAVTLADDCGGAAPWTAPAPIPPTQEAAKADSLMPSKSKGSVSARAKRRCEQTSMQLAIVAGDASKIQVKSVELFDEAGKSLGVLAASKPTRWADASGSYEVWDEAVAAGSTSSVSYVLAQPNWDQIGDRWNRTYTLKTVLSVGGADQAVEKAITLTSQASLPPNVKT